MKRPYDRDELYWITAAVSSHRSALAGERLKSLRTQVSEAKQKVRLSLVGLAGGIACIVPLLVYRQLVKDHELLFFILLFMGSLSCFLYSTYSLLASLATLYKHTSVITKHKGNDRLPEEEHEAHNALGRLATIVHENAIFVHLCRSRWEVYVSLRDSGQIDPHHAQEEVLSSLTQAEHESSEEIQVVNGLLLRHKYMNSFELDKALERIHWRPDLRAIGDRLGRMTLLDPETFHQKLARVNNYELKEDPRIGELLPLLSERLAA